MLSNAINEDQCKSPISDPDWVLSVLISNYPLSNGGYLVSFGKDESDGSFRNYDPVLAMDFKASKLADFLEFSSVFLPKGCYYLPHLMLGDFIRSLSSGASFFEMDLLPASSQLQGLLLVKIDEASLSDHEQEEED